MISGDFNASVNRLPTLQAILQEGHWTNLGEVASAYGGVNNDYTCQANCNASKTIRDYAILNQEALDLLHSFKVDHDSGLPVHGVLQLAFRSKGLNEPKEVVKMPMPIQKVFDDVCLDRYTEVNRKKAIDKQGAKDKQVKKVTFDIKLPESEQYPVEPKAKKLTLAENVIEALGEADKEDQVLEEDISKDKDLSSLTQEQKQEVLAELHGQIDAQLDQYSESWDDMLHTQSTDKYMQVFARCVEKAVKTFANLDWDKCKAISGRSTINTRTDKNELTGRQTLFQGRLEPALDPHLARISKQIGRLEAIKACVSKNVRVQSGTIGKANICAEADKHRSAFLRCAKSKDPAKDAFEYLDKNNAVDLNFFTLDKHHAEYVKNFQALLRRRDKSDHKEADAKFRSRKAHANVSKILKHNYVAPMTHLMHRTKDSEGKVSTKLVATAKLRDEALHQNWDPITEGNHKSLREGADGFRNKYKRCLFEREEFKLKPLTVEDYKATCLANSVSAPGLDGWSAGDLALLSDRAFGLLVNMLNAIEQGKAQWPEHMLETRAVFLSKDPNKTHDPLAYRPLKITSVIYRKWAGTRLQNMSDWIDEWDHPALHVICGKGARQAWLHTGLAYEHHKLQGLEIAGGSIDIFKCFDQINRTLLYDLARDAGMPRRVLDPYFAYIDNLQVRYQMGQDIGIKHHERCSIPQGCPFSMAMVALITRTWVLAMEEINVEPRCLADDLLFSAIGTGHRSRAIQAMRASRSFFVDMGARVADNKCFMFATDAATRSFLSKFNWDSKGLSIPVVNKFRDLGAHLNFTQACNGSTLTERMRKGIRMARMLCWLPIPQEFKEKNVRANVLPASLYGCEVTYINEQVFQQLRAAIAKAVGPASARRSVDMVFNTTCCAKDLDPESHVLYLRVAAIRRAVTQDASCLQLIKLIVMDQNSRSKNDDDVQGPIGFLISQLARHQLIIDGDLNIHCRDGNPISALQDPWQHLKKVLFDTAARTRTSKVNTDRTFHGNVEEIDNIITTSVFNKFDKHARNVYRYIFTGAMWDEHLLADIGRGDGTCPHCAEKVQDNGHVLWKCPTINKHRKNRKLDDLDADCLPRCIQCGIPPALAADLHAPFWGKSYRTTKEVDNGQASRVGLPINSKQAYGATCDNNNIAQILACPKEALEKLPGRVAFSRIKDKPGKVHDPMPYRCTLCPPDEPNVYSDGSWKHPLVFHYSLGGAGVWWPGRRCTGAALGRHSISPVEDDFAFVTEAKDGVRLCTKIGGYAGSSTRTELAAAILAMCANGPVHLASDSAAFVNKANAIAEMVKVGKKPKRHFNLTSDGDLWGQFYEALLCKGAGSVRFTWVKGHATQQHVDSGITTESRKVGNCEADKCADQGVLLHGEDVIHFAKTYSGRHKAYSKFMMDVAIHITEAYLIHRELTRIKEAKATEARLRSDMLFKCIPLVYPDESQGRKIELAGSCHNYRKLLSKHPSAHAIEHFLSNICIVPAAGTHRGATWLELYIIYRIKGYPKPIQDPANKAKAPCSLDKQLKEFKACLKALGERLTANGRDCLIMRPNTSGAKALIGLGVDGPFQGPSFNACITAQMQTLVAKAILPLAKRYSQKDIDGIIAGTRSFMRGKANFKGKAGWDGKLPKLANPLEQVSPSVSSDKSENVHMYVSRCPLCKIQTASEGYQFDLTDLDNKVKCKECNKTSAGGKWLCSCEVPWHVCVKHIPVPKVKRKSVDMPMPPSKRRYISPQAGELLDQDLEREAKRARKGWSGDEPIEFDLSNLPSQGTLKASMLPLSLQLRFPAACAPVPV
jgi:ribonuclease HI